MPIIQTDYIDVLQESLNERDKQLQEKKLPEINIASAIPVSEGLEFGIDSVEYGVTKVKGSVKDGIIGHKTTSLKTIDSEVEFKKATVVQWAKAATWTQQELEKVALLNISLQTKKQDDLYKNALSTIQYVGYVGHQDVAGQEGLFTGSGVEIITDASNKTIAEMTSNEVVTMILNAYNRAWKKSGYTIQPTHLAMDAEDFMALMQKFDVDASIVGTDMLPISAMDRIMAALRKASENDSFSLTFIKVPSRYPVGIAKGATRLALYTYDSEYVEMRVHMPELIDVVSPDLLVYKCGYRAAFSGALWYEPNSAVYLDYKTSAATK